MPFVGPESSGKNNWEIFFFYFLCFHVYFLCLFSITRSVISCQGKIFRVSEELNAWSNLKEGNFWGETINWRQFYRGRFLRENLPDTFSINWESSWPDKTNEFLWANKILYNYQSGFRTNHSINLCLSFLTDKRVIFLEGFDEGLLTGMILIDLQKAFDIINHKILLKKLEAIVFSDKSIRWFWSYL